MARPKKRYLALTAVLLITLAVWLWANRNPGLLTPMRWYVDQAKSGMTYEELTAACGKPDGAVYRKGQLTNVWWYAWDGTASVDFYPGPGHILSAYEEPTPESSHPFYH